MNLYVNKTTEISNFHEEVSTSIARQNIQKLRKTVLILYSFFDKLSSGTTQNSLR